MITAARWANGMPVTEDEAIEVLMWYFGENAKEARLDLFTISVEKLQSAVNYYLKNKEN